MKRKIRMKFKKLFENVDLREKIKKLEVNEELIINKDNIFSVSIRYYDNEYFWIAITKGDKRQIHPPGRSHFTYKAWKKREKAEESLFDFLNI